MSQTIEYRLSVTPEPYESALTPKDISIKEIKARATVEENYAEAVAKHAAWKEVKMVAEQEEKLRLAREAWAANVEALKQKAEEKRKVEEKRQEEEWLHLLKERQEAEEKQRLAELKEKVLEEAAEKKRKDDLKKEKKEAAKKLREEQKVEKIAALIEEEKGSDADTEEEVLESPKKEALKKLKDIQDGKWKVMAPVRSVEKNKKRKQATKSTIVVEESDGEGKQGPSKRVRAEVSGPAEGEKELLGNSKCISLVGSVMYSFHFREVHTLLSRFSSLLCTLSL